MQKKSRKGKVLKGSPSAPLAWPIISWTDEVSFQHYFELTHFLLGWTLVWRRMLVSCMKVAFYAIAVDDFPGHFAHVHVSRQMSVDRPLSAAVKSELGMLCVLQNSG